MTDAEPPSLPPAAPQRVTSTLSPDEYTALFACVVAACVSTTMAIALLLAEPIAGAISLGVPCAIGALSGMVSRDGRSLEMFACFWALIACAIAAMLVNDAAGVFCGAIYAVAAFPPGMVCGLLVIAWRRRGEQALGGNRSGPGVLLLVSILPWAMGAYERQWPRESAPESLTFACDIEASCAAVWSHSLAFETRPTSWWQLLRSPLPRHAQGRATAVDDEKTIRFAKGVIRVRVVAVEPGRRLVGEVLEQTIERRALLLHTVTITCEPLAAQRTRATLSIDFEPRMGPRWYWRPFEHFFGGITFEAVLGAWSAGASAEEQAMPEK